MCCVNVWNLRYFVLVRDENCSDLKTEGILKFYGFEVVSSPLLVHTLWTRFSTLVTHICTLPGIRCENVERPSRILEVASKCFLWRIFAEIFKTFLKNTVSYKVSYLDGTVWSDNVKTV